MRCNTNECSSLQTNKSIQALKIKDSENKDLFVVKMIKLTKIKKC